MIFPVVRQALVETSVLFFGDIGWFPLPDGFVGVDFFELVGNFFDFLFLLFLLLVLAFFLDLTLVFFLLFVFHFVIFISDFLLFGLFDVEFNRELDELGMLADDVLGFLFVELLELVVFHVQDHLSAAGEAFCFLRGSWAHAELLSCR